MIPVSLCVMFVSLAVFITTICWLVALRRLLNDCQRTLDRGLARLTERKDESAD